MKRNLKSYQITLTVTGPVFVGSGREISKKEYLFLQNKKAAILNIEKLYGMLTKKHLQREYEKYMLSNQKETLGVWLRRNQVSVTDTLQCVRYYLENQDTMVEKGRTLQIMECMKDPYGNPYIPGSSVKGMLRTILLCDDIIRNPEKYRECREMIKKELFSERNYRGQKINRKQVLARAVSEAERKCYYLLDRPESKSGDAVNDILSGIIISDSEPLDIKDLVLCQKIERHPDGREKKMNLLRECLRPGTKIRFSLTVDESICSVTDKQIMQAIKVFSELYYDNFLRRFIGSDRLMPDTVFLGGGSGFVSKTVLYALFPGKEGIRIIQEIFRKTGVPENHDHKKDLEYDVAPHILKCTCFQGKTYQMGMCHFKIE